MPNSWVMFDLNINQPLLDGKTLILRFLQFLKSTQRCSEDWQLAMLLMKQMKNRRLEAGLAMQTEKSTTSDVYGTQAGLSMFRLGGCPSSMEADQMAVTAMIVACGQGNVPLLQAERDTDGPGFPYDV